METFKKNVKQFLCKLNGNYSDMAVWAIIGNTNILNCNKIKYL